MVASALQDCGHAGVRLFFDGGPAARYVPAENQGVRRALQTRASGHAR